MALHNALSVGLLKLPNELLIDIAACLCIPDLRRLARANHQLYFFVTDYLWRYRYNSRLLQCPNEIILEIVQHLGSQKVRSRFARASQRLYPITMNYIVRHNVRYGAISLLNYASTRNLRRMTQLILRQSRPQDGQKATARTRRNMSIALYQTIKQDASTEAFVHRKIHEDAYQIVSMLLEHGADPDAQITFSAATARTIAVKHPDPRIRVLFPMYHPVPKPKRPSVPIRRLRHCLDQNDGTTYGTDSTPSEVTRYAMLSDYLETPIIEAPKLQDEGESDHENNLGNAMLDAAIIRELARSETARLKKTMKSLGPPPLSAFPRLRDASTAPAEGKAQGFWAELPHRIFSAVPAVRGASNVISIAGTRTLLPKRTSQPDSTEADPFPVLVHSDRATKDAAKDVWGEFRRNRIIADMRHPEGMFVHGEHRIGKGGTAEGDMQVKHNNKKKKWQRLLL